MVPVDESATQRIGIDATVSDQERGRERGRGRSESRSRSPNPSDLRLIEGKVDEILKKQNIECPAFPETSSEKSFAEA